MAVKKQKLLQKADGLARDKKFKKAIVLYKEAIAEDPNDIRTRLRLSELLYQAGRTEEALAVLRYVGDYYREHGFLLKSVAVYKKMVEVDPKLTELHGTLAALYFQLGMAPDAIRQFKSQIRALIRQGKIIDSLHVVRSMLELDPGNVMDRLRLAEAFSRHELIDEAAVEYRRVLAVLEKSGRTPDWGKVALRYLHHSPDDFEARKSVVEFLVETGDYLRALQHLLIALNKDPMDVRLLGLAATSFELLGQPGKAIVALKSLAALYRHRGQAREEQEALVKVLGLDPKDAHARRALGMEESADEAPAGEVVLEWEMPAGFKAPEPPPVPDLSDTVYEPPSFAEEWVEDATIVETIDPDALKELMALEEDREPSQPAVDILALKRAIDARKPLSPDQLGQAGVPLAPEDREELAFFLASGLKDEAMAILQETYNRLTRKGKK
jgi:tetratricopeptide (TPR) repeat protein